MKRIYKHIAFAFAITLISSNLYGEHSVRRSLDDQVKSLLEKLDQITVVNAHGEESVETGSAIPDVGGRNWFDSIDLLFWKSKVSGTKFAYSNSRFSVNQPIQGRTKECEFDWNAGIRVGIGRNFNHDQWSVNGEFTYFKDGGCSRLIGGETSAIIPIRGPFSQPVHMAKSSIRNKFANLDVNLYRHYFISSALALKPTIGLKNSWINIKQIVKYNDGDNLEFNTAETTDRSKFWGIGPKAGIDTTWFLNSGFHIYGLVSTSLLYSYFEVEQFSKLTPTENFDFLMKEKKHRFIPNIQFNLGLGYSRFIRQKRNYLEFRLGYETLYYFSANQMLQLREFNGTFRFDNMSEDISMYGVTFQAKLFF
ncbi:hypothetical protein COB11_06650 [Candidatus Aerophobetes bacterium]|uniref:Protochlamydia outer membrane protein domain-containing protein n=1 Tax=Aerophobetes bacterium TaxID=2030807 RepID=A0A2A4YD92_UNCAE|nr:MAG: hypothetical protein COB11_06650 [Candidatus Aerophobetes bacterium]